MRVCVFFHNADKYNGATHSMLDLIKTWKQRNSFEIVCILPNKGTAVETLTSMDIDTYIYPFHGVRYLTTEKSKCRFLKNILRIVRLLFEKQHYTNKICSIIQEKEIDIIYSNTGSIYIGAWVARRLQLEHYWHIREMGEEDQNAKMLLGNTYFIKLLNQSTKIIAISDTVKNKYINYLVDKTKIVKIYNDVIIVPHPFFNRCVVKEYNTLIVGSIIEGKGHEQVIRAIAKASLIIPTINLYIAGKSSGNYYEDMKKLVKELRCEDRVHFLGHIKDMDVLKEKMHLQIVPSRCEAFGRITIEAMSSGLPLIGANTGCTAELIINCHNGLLYEYGNINDLLDKIIYTYDNYNEMIVMAKTGYNECKQFMRGEAAIALESLLIEKKHS